MTKKISTSGELNNPYDLKNNLDVSLLDKEEVNKLDTFARKFIAKTKIVSENLFSLLKLKIKNQKAKVV